MRIARGQGLTTLSVGDIKKGIYTALKSLLEWYKVDILIELLVGNGPS